jgi:glycosyltransferase involved in cell wall biosynthesis
MKVLFVINNFYLRGNGLCASARRTVHYLKEAGVDVRVLSGRNKDPEGPQPEYPLDDLNLPFVNGLVEAQGYQFASTDKDTIRAAVDWADLVHLEEPMVLEARTAIYARKTGKAITGTYHMHPENMYASVGLDYSRTINWATLNLWRDLIFNYCSHIQCPTQNVLDRLKRHRFKAELHLISNGIIPDPVRSTAMRDPDDKSFRIVNIGRLSNEKDQMTLLKAVSYSGHSRDLRLIFAGRGPEEEAYRKKAAELVEKGTLRYPPEFVFLDSRGLKDLAHTADLFVHCAYIEVEGLSCLESLREGVVPLIAKGKYSATSQFALDHHSTFPAKDPKALARKIDWWIEHPERRMQMAPRYAALAAEYDIHKSIDALVDMFRKAIGERNRHS